MENGVPQLSTKITEMLGIRYPVFQGGMAWVADASIASAVSNAGGLGIIGCGPWDIDTIQAQVRACKEKTDKPFGLNIMLMSEYVDDIMQMVLDEDIRVITTGAGNPGKYIPRLKERDIKVIPVAGSVAIAKRVAKVGADAVIAEGLESGGHLGEITTMALVPQVVDAVDIPVIVAGGLGPDNVAQVIAETHPWGVDSLTGTNKIFPDGSFVKDIELVRAFCQNAKAAGQKL